MAVQFLQSNMADNDDVLFTEGFDCVIYVFIIGFVWLISSRQQKMCRAELFHEVKLHYCVIEHMNS